MFGRTTIDYAGFDEGNDEERERRKWMKDMQMMMHQDQLGSNMQRQPPQRPGAPNSVVGAYDSPGRAQPTNDQMGGFFKGLGNTLQKMKEAGIYSPAWMAAHNDKMLAEAGPWWKQVYFGRRGT